VILVVEYFFGLIAFIVGVKIKFFEIKANKKVVFWGTFFESMLPIFFVFLGFYLLGRFFGVPSQIAVILASVASTIAPEIFNFLSNNHNAIFSANVP
jgi:ABC-type glycerol-3-phosphate transport system permease component